MRTLYLAAFVLLFLTWPILLYEAFSSLGVALLSPLALVHGFHYLQMTDVYWASGWALLIGFPALLAAHRHFNRWTFGALVGATVAASFATMMRAQAGLGILIAGLALVLIHVPSWRRRALAGAVLVVAYLAVTPIGVKGVIAYRDHELGSRTFASTSGGHILWHPVFLGLGWQKNPWGIYWYDGYAAKLALKKDPKAVLPNGRYDQVIRGVYFDDVTDDPGFVVRLYLRKLVVALDIGRRSAFLGLASALVALSALVVPRLRRQRADVLLLLPGLLLALVPEILVLPYLSYGMGFTTAVALLALLPLAWLVAAVERQARGAGSLDWAGLRRWRPGRGTAEVALVAAAAVATFFVARDWVKPTAAQAEWDSARWQYHSMRQLRCDAVWTAPVLTSSLPSRAVRTIDFSHGLPAGWQAVGGARVSKRAAGGVGVRTTTLSSAYQLVSPPMTLPRGTYTVALDGGMRAGGMSLGLLDAAQGSWIKTATFFGRCPALPKTVMALTGVPTAGQRFKIVLANYDPSAEGSSWIVRHLTIYRQGA
jgi:hypothetical protein